MKTIRTLVACALALSLATSAHAQSSIAESAQAGAAQQLAAPASSVPAPARKPLLYGGAALFAGGMATAIYGFIRVGNGEFSRFGEASSRNKPLGAAGLAAAFAGGTMMYLGTRAPRYAPSAVTVNPGGVTVERTVTW